MPDDAIERRIAEVLTRDRSSGLCPLDGPCASCDCFDPLHAYDRAHAKAVMAEVVTAELGRLRNRITALEAKEAAIERVRKHADELAAMASADWESDDASQAVRAEMLRNARAIQRALRAPESPADAPSEETDDE